MSTATEPSTDRNASGRKWSAGPYVRKGERDLWNALYEEFSDELRVSANYPEGVKLTDLQIDVLAGNCAYRVIWTQRED